VSRFQDLAGLLLTPLAALLLLLAIQIVAGGAQLFLIGGSFRCGSFQCFRRAGASPLGRLVPLGKNAIQRKKKRPASGKNKETGR